jgi:hypothetical protein
MAVFPGVFHAYGNMWPGEFLEEWGKSKTESVMMYKVFHGSYMELCGIGSR